MGKTILVVDDDLAIIEFVTAALEDEGYSVVSAVNGAALSAARMQRPAVVLLDLNMPQMDGVEVSKRLRADPRTADIPIVVMSAKYNLSTAGPQLQADDQLPKPFRLNDLYATVDKWARAG